jgi:beta-lactamase class A
MHHRLSRRHLTLLASATIATRLAPAAARQAGAILPDTPAGAQLAWVLAWVNGDIPMPTTAELPAHFSPTFLAAMPAPDLLGALETVAAAITPFTLTEIVSSTPTDVVALGVAGDGTGVRVVVVVQADAPFLIDGLWFEPADPEQIAPTSIRAWSDLDAALLPLAARLGIAVAELTADGVVPIHSFAGDEVFALGSVFKLYVLGAVVDAVRAGRFAWDTPVVIDPARKSLPSGITQDEPDGADLPVFELAARMIALSDNTATDLLIHLLGREAVEAMLAPMGNSVPDRNVPFLSTRESFVLKLSDGTDLRDRYLAAGVDERRALLAGEIAAAPLPSAAALAAWTAPIAIDTVEWFATPLDLARAHAYLAALTAETDLAGLRPLLQADGDLGIDPAQWPWIAFKGGSEPGVLALAFLLERIDGRRFSVSVLTEHATGEAPTTDIIANTLGALELLAAFN